MSRTLQPGNLISHYRIVGPLGAGGMGEVYLAHDLTLERNVALKILPRELVRNEERVRRFVLEAKSASSLSHPHIVTIYEIGQDVVRASDEAEAPEPDAAEPVHFIAMELVTGETLKEKIYNEKADLRTLLGYLAQAADGLAKAHAAGIVHRDLKPGNIMVTRDGYAKVLDFGLAKLTEKQSGGTDMTSAPTEIADLTGGGGIVGTVGYMSPEQVRGKTIDPRSDVFSFGCILYESATRQRPFMADSDIETMHKILNEKPPDVGELSEGVPSEVRRLIRRCLAKSPDQRFQSIKDVAIELREIVDEYDSLSASAASGSSIASPGGSADLPRRRGPGAGIIAAVAIGVAGIAFGLWSWVGGRTAAPAPDEPFQTMRMTSVTGGSDILNAVISPDGRYLATLRANDGLSGIQVRQVATGSEVQVMAPQDTPVRGLTFSNDGEYLYYLRRDPDNRSYSALFEIPSLGGASRKRIFDVDSPVGFSPDGRQIAFARGVPQEGKTLLMVADLASGAERTLATVKQPEQMPQPHLRPAWSPDGARIATVISSTEGGIRSEVVTFDLADGRRTSVGDASGGPEITSIGWLGDDGLALSALDIGAGFVRQIYRLSYPDGARRRITNDLNQYTDLSVTRDGSTIAAMRDARTSNLYSAPLEGDAGPRQLTTGSSSSDAVNESRPGSDGTILFTSLDLSSIALWSLAPDGSSRRKLSTESHLAVFNTHAVRGRPAVIYNAVGTDIVPHVWKMDLDGGNAVQLTQGTGEGLQDVSPDGERILYNLNENPRKILIRSVSGGEPIEIAADGGDARFSPDGTLVLFAGFRESGDQIRSVLMIARAGGGEPLATFVPSARTFFARWSPDSKGLDFLEERDGIRTLMRWRIAGGEPTALLTPPEGRMGTFEWSGDGKRLLFYVRTGQTGNLWTWSPGGKARPLTDFRTGDIFEFHWAADGNSAILNQGIVNRDIVLVRGSSQDGR